MRLALPENGSGQLPPLLRVFLLRRAALDRLLLLGKVLGYLLVFSLLWLILIATLDRIFAFGGMARSVLDSLGLICIALSLIWLIWNLTHPVNFIQIAASLEPAFNQRLETLVSQRVKPAASAPSPAMLEELWRSVELDMPRCSAMEFVSWRKLLFPWLAGGFVTGLAFVLWYTPSFGGPQLLARFMHPRLGILPVTTTQLIVWPGNAKVVEQSTLNVRVVAARLGAYPPVLHFSSDAVAFAKASMSPSGDGFVWQSPALQKNLSYYIIAGDARTPVYHVTVLPPPTLSEIHVHYEYPAYTRNPPLDVSTTKGLIEAPLGTGVELDVISLTPLGHATLQWGPQLLNALPGASANIEHFSFVLDHDGLGRLHLTGANGVPGKTDFPIQFTAVPDQPPLAELLAPSSDMHLAPRDLLTIAWRALDDFGVEKIFLQWQINDEPSRQIPLPLSGDPRQCAGAVDVDLANMPLKIGDSLSITLLAVDGAGHTTQTSARHIAISPRSVDIDTYLRLAALRQASDLSATLTESLRACTVARLDRDQVDENLASASDAAALLKQTILEAMQHASDPKMADTISQWGDHIACISACIERAQVGDENQIPIARSAAQAKQIQDELAIITTGEQAAIALADRANVREMADTRPSDPQGRLRMAQTLTRAAADADAAARAVGTPPADPHAESELEAFVHAEAQDMQSAVPVDLHEAAAAWAKQMSGAAAGARQLAARLEMASALESVKPHGQAVWARTLEITARAAHRIEDTALHDPIVSRAVLAKVIADYPASFQVLLSEHEHAGDREHSENLPAAAAALAQMKLWAAEPDLLSTSADVLNQPVAQDLALEANALMAQHDYAGAAAVDARLADTPEARLAQQNIIAAERQMRTAERVDQVNAEQQAIAAQTNSAARISELARDQERVAQSIEQVRQSDSISPAAPNSREDAMVALTQAQHEMAAMPSQLTDVNSCRTQVEATLKMADNLNRFAPDTSAAVQALQDHLAPSLKAMAQASGATSPESFVEMRESARGYIKQAQLALSQAQHQYEQQDPLLAAKWFASAAASALSRQPPDLITAHQQQGNFAQALQSVWSTLIRRAALERLAGGNTIAQPMAGPSQSSWHSAGPIEMERNPDTEPVDYAQALQMYFQQLSQEHPEP